jgi:hypothetical protein
MDPILATELISIDVTVIVLCGILLKFMIKPYLVTGENRYLGLPLGFGVLGLTYFIGIISVIGFFEPIPYLDAMNWLQLSLRSFAFAFLALTYYFSKKSIHKTRIWWNIALSVLIVALLVSCAIVFVIPQFGVSAYRVSGAYTRVFNVLCLAFISTYTIRSYLKKRDPATGGSALGYIQLAISQFLLIFWFAYWDYNVFWTAMIFLLSGILVFVFVSYNAFYGTKKGRGSE